MRFFVDDLAFQTHAKSLIMLLNVKVMREEEYAYATALASLCSLSHLS